MGDFFKIDKDRFARAFAYNTGSPVPGTGQVGNLAYEITNSAWEGDIAGLEWWNGPDERNTWIVGKDWPQGDWNTPIGDIGDVHFWKTNFDTLFEFKNLVSNLRALETQTGSLFTSSMDAKEWLDNNDYFTNFVTASWMIPEYESYEYTENNLFRRFNQSIKVAMDTRLPNATPYSSSVINNFICGMQNYDATESLSSLIKVSTQFNRINNSIADPDYGYAIFDKAKGGAMEQFAVISEALPSAWNYRRYSGNEFLGDDLTLIWIGFRPDGIGLSSNSYHSNPFGIHMVNGGLGIRIAYPYEPNVPALNLATSVIQNGQPNAGKPNAVYLESNPAYNTLLMRGIRFTKTGGSTPPFTYDIEFIVDGTLQNPTLGAKNQQVSWSMDFGIGGQSYFKMNSEDQYTTSQGSSGGGGPYCTGFLGFFAYRSSLSSAQLTDIWNDISSSHAAKVAAFDKDTWPFPHSW